MNKPMTTPCTWDGNTLVVNILGTPAAKRDAIGKIKGHQLKVSVTAPPEDGRATDHMVKFLAREFGVASKDITVVFGRTSVNKQLRIRSPRTIPEVLQRFGDLNTPQATAATNPAGNGCSEGSAAPANVLPYGPWPPAPPARPARARRRRGS